MVARSLDELLVYRKAQVACVAVSALLERPTLRTDRDLKNQIGSASAAVPANIAEGFGQSDLQFAHYLVIARGSTQELRSHLAVACQRKYLSEQERHALHDKFEEIAKMLSGLIKYLRASRRKRRR